MTSTTASTLDESINRQTHSTIGWLMTRQTFWVFVAAVLAIGYLSIATDTFFTAANLFNVARNFAFVGIIGLGMTAVIITGGIDLSVGALLAVAGVVAASLSAQHALVAIVAGVGVTTLLGALNGVIITKARIQPFIVTLAMLIAARGAALGATGEQSVSVDQGASAFIWLGRGGVGPIPAPVALLLLAFVAGWAVLRYTRFGRHVYAIGDSEDAARLMGLDTDGVVIGTYALSGALAGLGGVVLAARLGAGQPVAGIGWELDAIAAVVVGGTLLTGGVGGAVSTLIGVLLLGVIFNLLNLEGTISPWWQSIVRGVFLLGVVVAQSRLQRRAAS